jgi:hypothetical protein
MAVTAAELAAIEGRLRAILEPYAGRLETATIYNIPTLRRAGANAHNWFAFVKPASKHVGFYLLPIVHHPGLLDGLSPALAGRQTGKSVFTFASMDEGLFTELEALVARAFVAYMGGAGQSTPGAG